MIFKLLKISNFCEFLVILNLAPFTFIGISIGIPGLNYKRPLETNLLKFPFLANLSQREVHNLNVFPFERFLPAIN